MHGGEVCWHCHLLQVAKNNPQHTPIPTIIGSNVTIGGQRSRGGQRRKAGRAGLQAGEVQ